ncbi:MAG: hypothetical protein QOE54_6994, partial [Streptosporangiaceae bacterium]|nr:hypothetical protein [Streptosporangiaceae bacterium]
AIFWNVNRLPSGRSELEAASSERIRGLLVTTLAGSPDPGRDATAITTLVLGMTERFLTTRQTPGSADIDHLVRFCLHAIGEPATPA